LEQESGGRDLINDPQQTVGVAEVVWSAANQPHLDMLS